MSSKEKLDIFICRSVNEMNEARAQGREIVRVDVDMVIGKLCIEKWKSSKGLDGNAQVYDGYANEFTFIGRLRQGEALWKKQKNMNGNDILTVHDDEEEE